MSDELEIYEADKYKRKDDKLDFAKEEEGGDIIPTYPEYPEPGKITEPKEVKPPEMGIYRPSAGILESEPIVPKEIRHSKKIGLLVMSYYKVPPNTALVNEYNKRASDDSGGSGCANESDQGCKIYTSRRGGGKGWNGLTLC